MRGQKSDPFHSYRFHVLMEPDYVGATVAGFNSLTLPEETLESVEYREGIFVYTRKYPGLPTVTDLTLTRGVTLQETSFYSWAVRAIEGGPYRADLTVLHWHRIGKLPDMGLALRPDADMARKIVCYEAFPIRFKPAGDLDATSAEISIQEMDVAVERFEIIRAGAAAETDDWTPAAYLSTMP